MGPCPLHKQGVEALAQAKLAASGPKVGRSASGGRAFRPRGRRGNIPDRTAEPDALPRTRDRGPLAAGPGPGPLGTARKEPGTEPGPGPWVCGPKSGQQ
jgi:hypothetical protein